MQIQSLRGDRPGTSNQRRDAAEIGQIGEERMTRDEGRMVESLRSVLLKNREWPQLDPFNLSQSPQPTPRREYAEKNQKNSVFSAGFARGRVNIFYLTGSTGCIGCINGFIRKPGI